LIRIYREKEERERSKQVVASSLPDAEGPESNFRGFITNADEE
jgi:hypothetical protein